MYNKSESAWFKDSRKGRISIGKIAGRLSNEISIYSHLSGQNDDLKDMRNDKLIMNSIQSLSERQYSDNDECSFNDHSHKSDQNEKDIQINSINEIDNNNDE